MKKILVVSLLCGSLLLFPNAVHATEVSEPVQQSVSAFSDGRTRASWGEGILTHQNPLGRKPWAYAKSKTYAGKCHTIKARTKVVSGGYTDYTSWTTKSNASSATSATIVSRTEKNVKFTGNHELKDTASSGWQYATTSGSF